MHKRVFCLWGWVVENEGIDYDIAVVILPGRLKAGHLVLVQRIGVRIPAREPHKTTSVFWWFYVWKELWLFW